MTVVGEASVLIRAITTGLAKDIEKGVDKGIRDADLDSSADEAAEGFAERFAKHAGSEIGDSLEDAIPDDLGEKMGEGIGGDLRRGVDREVRKVGNDVDTNRISGSLTSRFRAAFTKAFNRKPLGLFSTLLGLDSKEERKAVGRFEKQLGEIKQHFGAFFGKVTQGLLLLGKLAVGKVVFQALSQGVVALIGQVGLLSEALVGAGIAGGAAFGLLGAAVAPIFLAFTTQTPILKKFSEQATKLLRSWDEFGRSTQRTLFPGLLSAMRITRRLIPLFSRFGANVGSSVGGFAQILATALTSEKAFRRFNKIFDNVRIALRSVNHILFDLGDAFSGLFAAAAPFGVALLNTFDKIAKKFADIINFKEANGSLTTMLKRWYDRAALVFGALTDIVVGLTNILGIGATSSVPLFRSFSDFAHDWRVFTESDQGRIRIKEVFDNSMPVAKELFGLVGDIFGILFRNTISNKDGKGMAGGIQNLRDALPKLERTLKDMTDKLKQPLHDLASSIGDLLKQFEQVGGIKILVQALNDLVDVLVQILKLPGFDKIISGLGALLGLFALMNALGIVDLLLGFHAILKLLVVPIEGLTAGMIELGLVAFAAVYAAVVKLKPILAAIVGVIAVVGAVLAVAFSAPVLAIIVAVGAALGAVAGVIVRNWDTIKNTIADLMPKIISAVSTAFEFVKKVVGDAAAAVGRFLAKIPGALSDAWDAVVEKTKDFVDSLQGPLDAIARFGDRAGFNRIPGMVDNIKNAFVSLGKTIVVLVNDVTPTLKRIGEGFIKTFQSLFNFAKLIARAVRAVFVEFIKEAGDALELLGRILKPIMDLAGLVLGLLGREAVEIIKLLIAVVKRALAPLGRFITRELADAFRVLAGVVQVVTSAFDFIMSLVRGDLTGAFKAFRKFIGGLGDVFVGLAMVVVDVFRGLVEALPGMIGAVIRFFIDQINVLVPFFFSVFQRLESIVSGIPGAIGNALASFGTFLVRLFVQAVGYLGDHLGDIFQFVIRPFGALPMLILHALGAFGQFLIDNVGSGAALLAKFFSDRIDDIVGFFLGLPDRLREGLGNIASFFLEVGGNIVSGIVNGITNAAGAVKDFAEGFGHAILKYLDDHVFHLVRGAIRTLADTVGHIPLLGDDVADALNKAADSFHIPGLAKGGIFDKATPAIVGEAGREVVIPLTDPIRALQLAKASGLFDVLARANTSNRLPSTPSSTGGVSGAIPGSLISALTALANSDAFGRTPVQIVVPGATLEAAQATGDAVVKSLLNEEYRRTGR